MLKTLPLLSRKRPINATIINKRFLSVKTSKAIMFEKFGKPEDVLQLKNINLPDSLGPSEVLIKIVAAPIHPADLNIIENLYGEKAKLPAVAGTEGAGVVVETGNNVKGLKMNDQVVPIKMGGSWSTYAIYKEEELLKIPGDIPKEYASTLSAPSTAIRLLEDFVDLKPGDVIIQNGANGMVGSAIYQIAHSRGIKSINIIRDRPDSSDIIEKMKALGAYLVVNEEYLSTPKFKKLISDLPKPKLALNNVGGSTATEMVRILGEGGTMVTYGGMSHKPVTIPTSQFIFNNISLKGFWLPRWLNTHSLEDRKKMFQSIYDIYRADKLKLWMETWDFNKFANALDKHREKFRQRKVILTPQ